MPVYDYECPKCKCKFESKISMEFRRLMRCPDCKTKARIIIHPVIHRWKDGHGI